MKQIAPVKPELIKGYVEGKKAYHRVFPNIYYAIAAQVEGNLGKDYPQLESVVGPEDKQALMAKFPEKGEDVPLDWVAFGFYGIDMYHFHIGVLFDVGEWPVSCVVGLHVMDRYLSDDELRAVLPRIRQIDWASAVGHEPRYLYAEAVCEHRWVDPSSPLDFGQLDQEVAHIAERTARYYEAAAPAAALLRRVRS